ncbi:flagellar protein FliT [Brevibacillus daliensis]|uniref:flagellar protein FliT n=1 Tax=Brevibacillus daliensis TaxID=2892995 RepID=UPI001E5A8F40|nr:flagellar protein FliT [Brevibacillus daliensis]
MNTPTLKELYEAVLSCTEELLTLVQKEADPDEWNSLLDKRQKLIDAIVAHPDNTDSETLSWRTPVISAIRELEQQVLPLMQQQQKGVEEEIRNIKKSKQATEQYAGANAIAAYGAFFDKKN